MDDPSFSAELSDGVVHVFMNTPRSDINIFSHQAAVELEALLGDLDYEKIDAVVFHSRKPGSFVNGVGLLMANTNTVHSPEDVPRLTSTVRRAYKTVRHLPVPTIAAVQGTCYGCGVEFILQASYRLAERSQDTHFYMTELADYLFLPTFGATQDLPRLLGLPAATNFLMWGERWWGDDATRHGLVDECFPPDAFDDDVDAFVKEVVAGERSPHSRRATPIEGRRRHVAKAQAQILRQPPAYRGLYTACLDLMINAASRNDLTDADYLREAEACGRSLMDPMAKRALSYFFVRRLAHVSSERKMPEIAGSSYQVCAENLPALEAALVRRPIRGVRVCAGEGETPDVRFVPANCWTTDADCEVLLETNVHARRTAVATAYAPLFTHGVGAVELADAQGSGAGAAAFQVLTRLGHTVVPSNTRGERFATEELLHAYFSPIRMFEGGGGRASDVERTLLEFGFARGPSTLCAMLGTDVRLPPDASTGRVCDDLLDALLVSLLAFAKSALDRGVLAHASHVDVLAREILDFPLCWASLCRYLDAARAAEVTERAGARSPGLVSDAAMDVASRYVSQGNSFYR